MPFPERIPHVALNISRGELRSHKKQRGIRRGADWKSFRSKKLPHLLDKTDVGAVYFAIALLYAFGLGPGPDIDQGVCGEVLVAMLKSVKIEHFRLCQSVEIDLNEPIIALLGRNGAGKSTILLAIDTAARIATTREAAVFDALETTMGARSISLEFAVNSARFRYITSWSEQAASGLNFVETLDTFEANAWTNIVWREDATVRIAGRTSEIKIADLAAALPALVALLPAGEANISVIEEVLRFLGAVRYYALEDAEVMSPIVARAEYTKWLKTYESTGDAGPSIPMRLLHMWLVDKDAFDAIRTLLGANGLGLLDDFEVLEFDNRGDLPTGQRAALEDHVFYFLAFRPTRGPRGGDSVAVAYSDLSTGTRRVLNLLAVLLFDKSSVMLLEQPEDSLHQGLTKKLIGLLQQNALSTQLILATHSSAILNKLRPQEVRLVHLHEGFIAARSLTADETATAQQFMNEEGALYDFLEMVEEE